MLTAAHKDALKWMREHGGDAAVARTKAGGRQIMAQGEVAPFSPATFRALVDAGLAEYADGRFRLIQIGKAHP